MVIAPSYDEDVETDCGVKIKQCLLPGPDLQSHITLTTTPEGQRELRECAKAKGKVCGPAVHRSRLVEGSRGSSCSSPVCEAESLGHLGRSLLSSTNF
jgi:hypothetical protein